MDLVRKIVQAGDPVGAMWLLRTLSAPGNSSNLPQVYPISVSFSDDSRPLTAQLGQFGCDFICVGVDYDVERPNFALDAMLWKPGSDLANAKSPYVDLRIKVQGGKVIYINGEDARIQTIARHATSDGYGAISYLQPWTLFSLQSAQCTFTLKRALQSGEDPYVVHATFKGFVLPCENYVDPRLGRAPTPLEALRWLTDQGAIPPSVLPVDDNRKP